MKRLAKFSFLFFLLGLNGCIIFRYEFESALNNLPTGYKVIRITNYHIDYSLDNVVYRAHYRKAGEIYKTEKLNESVKPKYEFRYF